MTAEGRVCERRRKTVETDVAVRLGLDGEGRSDIDTGIPFFNHLLTAFACHGRFDLRVRAAGDLDVDGHHTVEDVGWTLGGALAEALGDRRGIRRFGWALVPMDESLARVALDLSGRPYLAYSAELVPRAFGAFHSDLAPEFWRALANGGGVTLHVALLSGGDAHHALEAIWKAAGLALGQAAARGPRVAGVPSTKGTLAGDLPG